MTVPDPQQAGQLDNYYQQRRGIVKLCVTRMMICGEVGDERLGDVADGCMEGIIPRNQGREAINWGYAEAGRRSTINVDLQWSKLQPMTSAGEQQL